MTRRHRRLLLARTRYLVGLHRRIGRREPVLVFSLPKVGTTSMLRAVEATGRPAVHCHWISQEGVRIGLAQERQRGATEAPMMLWRGDYLRRRMAFSRSHSWDIVCGVRDPLAQIVSGLFQAGEKFEVFNPKDEVDEDLMARLAWHVTNAVTRPDRNSLHWFTDELQAVTGINVFDEPFDHRRGYRVYTNANFRVLLIRFEDLPRIGSTALAQFVGAPSLRVGKENVGAKKQYSDLYRRFVDEAVLPETTLEQAYASDLARHFYTTEEIAGFRARWRIESSESSPLWIDRS